MSDSEHSRLVRRDGLDDCPDENDLVAFLEGGLPDARRVVVEAHCAWCERCHEGFAGAARDPADAAPTSSDRGSPALHHAIESVVHGVLGDGLRVEPIVGQRLGRFEIVGVEGRGQFGVVYRARDTELGRMVAMKVMRRARRQGEHERESAFRTEAAAAARLQHPNIVTLHDYGAFEGAPYLILELLEGETVRARLERDGGLTPLDALAIAIDVTRALVEAHAAGIIHRDIKPSNIFLCASGPIKVLDFGLAQLQVEVDPGCAPPSGSRSTAQAGTPRYMAPELFHGHPADEASDVYAVGVTLVELLTGSPPSSDPRTREAQIAKAAIAAPLRRLVHRATDVRRDRRFQRAGDLLAALTRVHASLAGRRQARRRLGLGVAAALAIAAAAVVYRGAAVPAPRASGHAVAVLGFTDLSAAGNTTWLSTALSEMLTTDLAASPGIRVAPQDRVFQALADLHVVEREDLDATSLRGLRRHLGVEYTVTGSYLSIAAGSRRKTRVDVRLHDAQGQLIDSVSELGDDGELLDIAARIGSRLRVRLAGTAITTDEARTLRASMPAAPDAIRLYAEGLARMRGSDLAGARDVLTRAVAAEPGFPLVHSALSQVLHLLGEETQMRVEAKLAFESSAELRRDERLLIEARYREAIDEWPRALALRRALHEWYPDDLEHGLELAEALDRHEQKADALAVIAELRRLPPPWRDDPRIDLCEATAQRTAAARLAVAVAAADKARALGARWLLARARVREAYSARELGDLARSLDAAEESRAICEALGDREGITVALFNAATTRLLRGDAISTVLTDYERGLELERQIGHRDVTAWMLLNIAFEYLMAGDPAQAARRLDEAEPIATGWGAGQAQLVRAMQWQDQGELDRAIAQLERVRSVGVDIGRGRGFELKVLGDALIARGSLDQARVQLERYMALDQPHDSTWYMNGMVAMSRLEVEAGHPARGEALARESAATCERTHNDSDLASAQVALARALVAERRFDEARAAADVAIDLTARSEAMPEWLDARILRAQARFGAQPGELDAALADAELALDRARTLGMVGAVFEARLASDTIASAARRPGARAKLQLLARDAGQHGFGLVARKALAAATATR